MLRFNRLLPTLACLLLGVSACVSSPKENPETRRLANLASSHGDWAAAMDLWSMVLTERRGQDSEARMGLGEALLRSGRGLGAIQVLRAQPPAQGLELEYGLLLARAHFSQKQVRAGGLILSGLLTEHAANVEVLTLYGSALLDGDREAKGLGLLLQALRVDVGDGALAVQVAQRARALNLRDMEGEAWILRLEAPVPPVEAYVGAAAWHIDQAEQGGVGPQPKVLLSLQQAVRLDPLNGRAWTLIGGLHAHQGDALEARQAYRKAVEVDPGDWEACLALAQMYQSLGDCSEARIWIEHALAVIVDKQQREPFLELQRSCE